MECNEGYHPSESARSHDYPDPDHAADFTKYPWVRKCTENDLLDEQSLENWPWHGPLDNHVPITSSPRSQLPDEHFHSSGPRTESTCDDDYQISGDADSYALRLL